MFVLTRKTRPSDVTGKIHTSGEIVRTLRKDGITTARCRSRRSVVILTTRHGFTVQEDKHEEGANHRPEASSPEPKPASRPDDAAATASRSDGPQTEGGEGGAAQLADPALVGRVSELVQALDAGIYDAILDLLIEAEESGKNRKSAMKAIAARQVLISNG